MQLPPTLFNTLTSHFHRAHFSKRGQQKTSQQSSMMATTRRLAFLPAQLAVHLHFKAIPYLPGQSIWTDLHFYLFTSFLDISYWQHLYLKGDILHFYDTRQLPNFCLTFFVTRAHFVRLFYDFFSYISITISYSYLAECKPLKNYPYQKINLKFY